MGELDSISCLKVWGNIQKPYDGIACLLVRADDTPEARVYGMASVWISPHQATTSKMGEALGFLSALTSEGSTWPYVFTQLYEGANHTPLPKGKHLSIMPEGKAESPCGQISQLEVCQLLSAGPQVIYPVGLNRGDQSVTIDLPEPLHTGSSVTTDEYPYVKVNILSPTPEDQDHAIPPLGKVNATLAVPMPKTTWEPRITLRVEVGNLIDRGMTDD